MCVISQYIGHYVSFQSTAVDNCGGNWSGNTSMIICLSNFYISGKVTTLSP